MELSLWLTQNLRRGERQNEEADSFPSARQYVSGRIPARRRGEARGQQLRQ
jgi:hypothetical protein